MNDTLTQAYLDDFNGVIFTDTLSFSGIGITNIEGLQYFNYIKTLSINTTSISDLTPLSGLTNLENLFLTSNKILDLTPLNTLSSLYSWNYEFQVSEMTQMLTADGKLIVTIPTIKDIDGTILSSDTISDSGTRSGTTITWEGVTVGQTRTFTFNNGTGFNGTITVTALAHVIRSPETGFARVASDGSAGADYAVVAMLGVCFVLVGAGIFAAKKRATTEE